MTSQDDYNLTDSTYYATHDPETILSRLRDEDPVHWTTGRYDRGFWTVTKHGDSRFVYENDRVFTSGSSGPMLPINLDWTKPVDGDLLSLQLSGAQLASMDGHPHALLRKAFSARFMQPSVMALEDKIRAMSISVLNKILETGACDFAVDVAGMLPLVLISHIMALPEESWPDIYRWAYMSTSPEDVEFSIGSAEETSRVGTVKLMEFCLKLALERRSRPGDDLLSDIAVTKQDGQYLSDMVVAFNGISFIAAGHETTRNALCGSLAELIANNPGELERLRHVRHDRAQMRLAVEEMVRWTSPLTHQLRTATDNAEIGGRQIKKGDWVVIWNNSANRDSAVFADPYRFDGTRQPNPHLGFAYGPHFCIGANLARLEMRILLELVPEHMLDLELVAAPEFTPSLILRGIKHMPIKFAPRPSIH